MKRPMVLKAPGFSAVHWKKRLWMLSFGICFALSAVGFVDLAGSSASDMVSRESDQVKGFVYEWFSLFDKNAPVDDFLNRIVDQGLVMDFPDSPLRSHSDFRKWYRGIQTTIVSANHTIKNLTVSPEAGGFYAVDLIVLWRARDKAGKKIEFLAHQIWKLKKSNQGGLKITQYRVSEAKP